jgi:hypothetical protein
MANARPGTGFVMKRTLVWSVALATMLARRSRRKCASRRTRRGPLRIRKMCRKATGLVLGRVVDGTTGDPIPDAVVTLTGGRARGAGPGAARGGAAPARGGLGLAGVEVGGVPVPGRGGAPNASRQLTGGDGRFVFHDLTAGTYIVNASAPGYLGGFTGPGAAAGPTTVDLAEAERRSDVKVRLWKAAVVSGIVVDEAGEPAVGVMVRAMRRSPLGGKIRYSSGQSGRTDDRGIYRITSLPPGDYVIAIPQSSSTVPAAMINSALQGMASGTGAAPRFSISRCRKALRRWAAACASASICSRRTAARCPSSRATASCSSISRCTTRSRPHPRRRRS